MESPTRRPLGGMAGSPQRLKGAPMCVPVACIRQMGADKKSLRVRLSRHSSQMISRCREFLQLCRPLTTIRPPSPLRAGLPPLTGLFL